MGAQSSRETCRQAEEEGMSYWKDNKCQLFTKEVCESLGGKWYDSKTAGNPCMANQKWVETGEKIDRSWFRRRGDGGEDGLWGGLRGEELERVLEEVCEGRWQDCGRVVEVRMG